MLSEYKNISSLALRGWYPRPLLIVRSKQHEYANWVPFLWGRCYNVLLLVKLPTTLDWPILSRTFVHETPQSTHTKSIVALLNQTTPISFSMQIQTNQFVELTLLLLHNYWNIIAWKGRIVIIKACDRVKQVQKGVCIFELPQGK